VRLAAAVAIVTAALLAAAVPAHADSRPNPSDLEAEIVCPTCKTTLDQSNSPIAARMKAFIRERVAAGDTSAQIKAQFVDQFGPGVLAEPPEARLRPALPGCSRSACSPSAPSPSVRCVGWSDAARGDEGPGPARPDPSAASTPSSRFED
jgi:cytochrome c-type biogenesis protein CcmH